MLLDEISKVVYTQLLLKIITNKLVLTECKNKLKIISQKIEPCHFIENNKYNLHLTQRLTIIESNYKVLQLIIKDKVVIISSH